MRQALQNFGAAQMPEIEQDAAVDASPLLNFLPDGKRYGGAGCQFHLFRRVAFQEPLAEGVQKIPTLSACAFRDQDAGVF